MLVSELIQQTRRYLLTGAIEERNKLTDAIGPSDVNLTLTHDVGSIDRGSKISIDLEDMYVWSKSSQVIDVDRAQFGSSAASHAANATVHVNSKFTSHEIWAAMNDELVSLSSPANGLYTTTAFSLTYDPIIRGYSFPFTVLDIIEIRYTIPGPTQEWIVSQSWEFLNNAGADFTTEAALFVHDGFPNQPLNIKAKVAFQQLPLSLVAETTLLSIPDEILDIVSIGAAYRLTAPREVRRNFDEVQGDTRRANEVPPGANIGASRELGRLRQERIREEAARLNIKHPARSPRYPFPVG